MGYREMRFVPAEGAENLEIRIRMVLKCNNVMLKDVHERLGYTRQYIFRFLKDGAILLQLGMLYQIMDTVGYDVIVKITKHELAELPKTGMKLSELIHCQAEDGTLEIIKDIAGVRVISFSELLNKLGYRVYFSFVHRETGEVM